MFAEILLIGVGLAMDAFAVAVCKGMTMKSVKIRYAVLIAVLFGGFQAAMPFVGWLLGRQLERCISSFDHWIAFLLLATIGGKMIYDTLFGNDADDTQEEFRPDIRELLLLAVATSIDALAVGVTFAFLNYPIAGAISIIGAVTFVIVFSGVFIGNVFGRRFEKNATIAGGIILLLIGLKILLEHTGILRL